MDAQLRLAAPDESDELAALYEWLLNDSDLRGAIRRDDAAPVPGHMGALADVLTVALGSGGAITALVASLRTYFTQRRSDIKIEIRTDDGASLVVDAKRVPDAEALLARAFAASQGDTDP